jgi:hypothetical protein
MLTKTYKPTFCLLLSLALLIILGLSALRALAGLAAMASSTTMEKQAQIYLPLINRDRPSQLLCWLRFGEQIDATSFQDASDHSHHGYCNGDTCPTLTSENDAVHFDGVDDYITLGNPSGLNFTGPISLEAWVKLQATDGVRNLIAHGYATQPKDEVLLRVIDGSYQVGSWDGTGHATSYSIPPEDIGAWVHLVGVYDRANWRLYRNGEQVSASPDAVGAVLVNGNWAIGARGTGTERFFQGALDEVAIYNYALSPETIQAHYQQGR